METLFKGNDLNVYVYGITLLCICYLGKLRITFDKKILLGVRSFLEESYCSVQDQGPVAKALTKARAFHVLLKMIACTFIVRVLQLTLTCLSHLFQDKNVGIPG